MASLGSPVLLVVGGLVAAVGGFALLGATAGEAGSTLVLGGSLLLISAIGYAVQPAPRAV